MTVLPRNRKSRLILSWEQIDTIVDDMTSRLREFTFASVIPISRGGLVLASMFAYRLRLPITRMIHPAYGVQSSHGSFLVVDDICDTGATILGIKSNLPMSKFVVSCMHDSAPSGLVDKWGMTVSDDQWVTFPWSPNDYTAD